MEDLIPGYWELPVEWEDFGRIHPEPNKRDKSLLDTQQGGSGQDSKE